MRIPELEKIARATPLSDSIGALIYSPIAPVTGIGVTAGMLSDDFREHDKSKLKALLPGVGAYRMSKRMSSQVKHEQEDARREKRNKVRPVAHAVAEAFGPLTSIGASAIAGSILSKDEVSGVTYGAAAGAAANIIGALAAAIRRRRTNEEQMASDERSVLWKYLVPGVSTYNSFKRIGRSQGDRDDSEHEKE